jgi:hypothetical protein
MLQSASDAPQPAAKSLQSASDTPQPVVKSLPEAAMLLSLLRDL